jgi:DNA topoisomerase-3
MVAIITDRVIIAQQIASALDMDVTTENEGYFQGYGFTLVWISGELVSLAPPADYGKNYLNKDDLPFIPEPFSLTVCKRKTARGIVVNDKTAVRQLHTVKKIFGECESIIVATDAGKAGELSFRRIYSYLQCEKPFRRLWLNSLTAGAIREDLKNLAEGSLFDNLYAAADCRAKADYLINFNASRAFGVATGLVSHPLGREQTPALVILCKRHYERRNFVSTRFFEHRITLGKDGLFQSFALSARRKNRRKAEKIYEHLKTFPVAQVTKMEKRSRIQPAPLLYSLTSLQRDASERHGFSAAKTMEIARKLYEERLISHPLTDSRHIPEAVFETVPKIIRQTAGYCGWPDKVRFMDWENLNLNSVKDANSHPANHHALIPTGIYPGYLSKEDRTVYEMIVSRTLETFAPDCRMEFIDMEATVNNLVLVSGKSRIIAPGWRSIQNREEDREQNESGEKDSFPQFAEGETVHISGWNMLTKKILPPPLHTESSLLQAMEKAGLGTFATRASIIETLLSCGYIERQGQNLIPTEKGLAVHSHVKNMKIADAELSGSWEKTLANIRDGKQNPDTFMTMIEIFTGQVTEEILSLNRTKGFTLRLDRSKPSRKKKG